MYKQNEHLTVFIDWETKRDISEYIYKQKGIFENKMEFTWRRVKRHVLTLCSWNYVVCVKSYVHVWDSL